MAGRTVALSLFFALFPNASREDVALLLLQPFTIACNAQLQPRFGVEPPSRPSGVGLAVRGIPTTPARRVPLGARPLGGVIPARTTP